MKLAGSLSRQVQRKPNARMTAEHGCLAIKLFRPLNNVLDKKTLLRTESCPRRLSAGNFPSGGKLASLADDTVASAKVGITGLFIWLLAWDT